jgi:hypothetical protein
VTLDPRFAYEPEPPRLAVGLTRKISTAQYESAEVSVHVSGITSDTSEEAIADLIDRQGPIVYAKLRDALKDGIAAARADASADRRYG